MKLSINGLSFSYEDKIIFDGLSLNLSSEKISVLIGQNGVGKSTLLRIIAGLEEQDKGEITLSNNSNDQILIRGNISYLGHKLALKENLSVHENINFWEKMEVPEFEIVSHCVVAWFSLIHIAKSIVKAMFFLE